MQESLAERVLRRDRLIVAGLLGLLFLLAALYTVSGAGMEMSAPKMTGMPGKADPSGMGTDMDMAGAWSFGHALLVFLMWWVMMIAMMLPSVAPVVLLYAALGRRGAQDLAVPRSCAAFVLGYLAVWALFSALATALQWGLEAGGLVSASMMSLTSSRAGALVLIAAGAFQFTPLKQSCLSQCRSPAEVLTRHRRSGMTGAFRMGVEHGWYCLGCCWFLMALLFVGGIMNFAWIVGLALWVAAEKYLPHGPQISKLAGAALVLWGTAILAGAL